MKNNKTVNLNSLLNYISIESKVLVLTIIREISPDGGSAVVFTR